MPQTLRLVVFNAEADYGPTLRRELLTFEGVKILAEVQELALLTQALQELPVDLLVVHLDPSPDEVLATTAELLADQHDLPCLAISDSTDGGVVLKAMRAGCREFLTKPLSHAEMEAALAKIIARKPDSHRRGQLISVIGTVGGVGCTTIAVNLAAELAQQRSGRVVLVDLDFWHGQVATYLDLQPNFSIADLCEAPEQIDQHMIEKAVMKHSTGVDVLARPSDSLGADQITAAHATRILSSLQEFYDFVVVDGPGRYDSQGLAVLGMADAVLVIFQLTVPSVRNGNRLFQDLSREGFNIERLKVVMNRNSKNNGSLTLEQVEKMLNQKLFATIAGDWQGVSTGMNMGEPLCQAASRSKCRQDIEAMARRLDSASQIAQAG